MIKIGRSEQYYNLYEICKAREEDEKRMINDHTKSTAGQWSGMYKPEGVTGPMQTKADIKKQAQQQDIAANINREADILRGTSVFLQISNFIEYYGVLYVLRVFSQVVADRFKENALYNELVGGLMALYGLYSTIALTGEKDQNKA